MATMLLAPERLSDTDLIAEVKRLAMRERAATVHLISALMELDARKLYLGEGYSSLFTYCTQVLHLSEDAAYARIEAARVARKYPAILERLADGSLTLTAVGLLAPQLTPANHVELIDRARHESKRSVEQLVAALRPQPAVVSSIRKLPGPMAPRPSAPRALLAMPDPGAGRMAVEPATPSAPGAAPVPLMPPARSVVVPLAPERFKVQFTIDRETHDTLRRAQDLLRHTIPSGDPGAVFSRALVLLVAQLEKQKHAETAHPRRARSSCKSSRHVSAEVKRAVWSRDGGQCAFVGGGRRCGERGFLEFHHVTPYAEGGEATVENIELRCRAHNVYEAKLWCDAVASPD